MRIDIPSAAASVIAVAVLVSTPALTVRALNTSTQPTTAGPIKVAVTMEPLGRFAAAIGGDAVSVEVLIPENADPHTWTPRPSRMRAFSEARLVIAMGSGIGLEDRWIERVRTLNPGIHIVNASHGVPRLPARLDDHRDDDARGYDPHVWLSPPNAVAICANIRRALSRIDPRRAALYGRNYYAYAARLAALDLWAMGILSDVPARSFVAVHPAWSYFAHRYGLEQIALSRHAAGSGLRPVLIALRKARAGGVRVVVASGGGEAARARVVAAELGAEVVTVSPTARDYEGTIRTLVERIASTGEARPQ